MLMIVVTLPPSVRALELHQNEAQRLCAAKTKHEKKRKLKWHIFPQSNDIQFSKGREYYADSRKKVLALADVDKAPLQTLHTLTLCLFLYKNSCCTVFLCDNEATCICSVFSSPLGSMPWFLSSVWRMRSASRRCTIISCACPATGTRLRSPWSSLVHKVLASFSDLCLSFYINLSYFPL